MVSIHLIDVKNWYAQSVMQEHENNNNYKELINLTENIFVVGIVNDMRHIYATTLSPFIQYISHCF